jgi:hypothetical protein
VPTTDTNYGNIFSIWDRLFRFAKKDVKDSIRWIFIQEDAHSHLPRLLKIPFEKYRAPVGSKFGGELKAKSNSEYRNAEYSDSNLGSS